MFSPRFPFFVDSVMAGDDADKAGSFRKGDRIVEVNGTPTRYFQTSSQR